MGLIIPAWQFLGQACSISPGLIPGRLHRRPKIHHHTGEAFFERPPQRGPSGLLLHSPGLLRGVVLEVVIHLIWCEELPT